MGKIPLAIRYSLLASSYGLIDIFVAGPGVRIGSASRANSHSSERVLRGSITSSTQNFSAERNGERSLLRRASSSFCFTPGCAAAAISAPKGGCLPPSIRTHPPYADWHAHRIEYALG